MADERVCFAGDLGSDQLRKTVTVLVPKTGEVPAYEIKGVLLKVAHEISFVTSKPVTFVLIGEAPDATGYVLDEHWKVMVR